MPRYFLHLRDHVDEVLDPEGVELPNLAAVIKAVLSGARDLISHEVKSQGSIDFRYRIDAEDRSGTVVYTLPFKDAVALIGL